MCDTKVAIMQPYFFPFLGYFQLINAVDVFVIADDLNFMKNSYINRNSILERGEIHKFTLNLRGASQNKRINEIEVGDNRSVLIKIFQHSYKKAPYFDEIYPLLENILNSKITNLSQFIGFSLEIICNYLEISTKLIYSSSIKKDNTLTFDDRIINICHIQESSNYINPIGGIDIYDRDKFTKHNIKLEFLQMNDITYNQNIKSFIPNLSIIDVLMFNSKEDVQKLLNKYELL